MSDHVSGTISYDLDDEDVDFDANFNLEETEYYSHEKLKSLLQAKRKSDISAIHLNIRSLP